MRAKEEADVAALAKAVINAQDDGEGWCAFCHEYTSAGDAHEGGCPVSIAEHWLKSRKKPKNEIRIFRVLQCAHRLRSPVSLIVGDGVEISAVVEEIGRRTGGGFSLADVAVALNLISDDEEEEYPITRTNLPAP